MGKKRQLTTVEIAGLLSTLKHRFEENMLRHPGIVWEDVNVRLAKDPDKLWSLHQMEETGGAPDVTGRDKDSGTIVFYDCSEESPSGRRSVCYDREGLESRKEHRPKDNALDMATSMGIELLTEDQYRSLQKLGTFDTKTSSWLHTPDEIRKLGGALFGDHRYGQVFIYHNGAQSYYAARGFRGSLIV